MKKILAVALTLMLIPFSAFGLEMLEDATLDDVTGQAGVSIATDVIMDVHFDTIAWGDSDGVGGPDVVDTDGDGTPDSSGGWVGLTSLDIQDLRIKIRDDLAAANFLGTTGASWSDIQLFTIDVATDGTGTYVHMLLGTQQVTFATMTGTVGLGDYEMSTIDPDDTVADDEFDSYIDDVLGTFYIGGFELLMAADSYVDIRAHGDAGVTIDFGVTIDSIHMDAMSWGDADGIGTDAIDGMVLVGADWTDAGYVGLYNADITAVTASGSLLIDVATMNETAINAAPLFTLPSGLPVPTSYLLYVYTHMLADGYDGSETAVLLQFDNLIAGMGTFTADVVLDGANTLDSAAASTLGSIYASGMRVTLDGWVGIFAH